jgi:hypothetical protein
MADRPGPRLLAASATAIAATTLACAVVLVIRRMQVSFDTSGIASVAAVFVGVILVTMVDVASSGAGAGSRSLQRLAVRLGLALVLAATLPDPAALFASPFQPLRLMATAVAVVVALFTLVAPGLPSLGLPSRRRCPAGPSSPRQARLRGRDRSADSTPPPGRRRRKPDRHRTPPSPPVEVDDAPPQAPLSSEEAADPRGIVARPGVPGILQQQFDRYVLPDERMECIRGTIHLTVVAGSRLVTGHVGFCPPFHHLPQVDVGTACEEVEATIVAAEILPWGARIECRLDEPADETILIPIDVIARASLPAIDVPPPSPLR